MKKIFLMTALAVTALGFGQSNDQGTIQINLLGGFAIGSATDKVDIADSKDSKNTIASGDYGLKAHYGLNEKISVGLAFKSGAYVLVPKLDTDLTTNTTIENGNVTMSLINIGLEGRYYVVNNDRLNFFVAPGLGFSTGSDKFAGLNLDENTSKTKYSGLTYGLNTGLNVYFGDVFGMIFQIGYEGSSLGANLDLDVPSVDDKGNVTVEKKSIKLKRGVGLIQPMLGFSFKF